ncbi:putative gustatory receptor 28b [Pseudolycoriella hygida]|uniref:Gustatory receptor n=1 Tax=Pseudolycoriella hygida TaxID=35572 RepID=A0A9Q0SA71_9DIPT|nr:putative gustatory receptor 28b [Pseudolycoriella hygida]
MKFVKEIFYPKDVYSSQRLFLISSVFNGLIPYNLVIKDGKYSLQTSVLGFSAAVVYVIIFSGCFLFTILNQLNVMEFFIKNAISNFGGNLNLITSFLSVTSVYLSSLYLRKKFKKMFFLLIEVDGKLFNLGVEVNHRNALLFNIKLCIAGSIALGIFTITSMSFLLQTNRDRDCSNIPALITHFQPYLVVTILVSTFVNFARLIRIRFEAANKILRNLYGRDATKDLAVKSCTINSVKDFKEPQTFSTELLAERKLAEVVKDVCSIHDDLCDTCVIAEKYFALKMLTIVGIGFLIIVFNLYYVMEIAFGQIPDEFQEESYKFLIFLICQVGMNILGILCIIQSSCAISNENEKCSIYVHKIMNTTNDEYAKERLKEFSLQLIHRNVRFTALNLFPLDRTLIFTV